MIIHTYNDKTSIILNLEEFIRTNIWTTCGTLGMIEDNPKLVYIRIGRDTLSGLSTLNFSCHI